MKPDREREIPKEVSCPRLTDRVVALLTDLCFAPVPGALPHGGFEALLVFGTGQIDAQHLCADIVTKVVLNRHPNIVYLTGGITSQSDTSEAHNIYAKIEKVALPDVEFVFEETSTCTKTNVIEVLRMGFAKHSSFAFVCKVGHYGRALLTLRKHIPKAMTVVAGYEYPYPLRDVGQGTLMMTRQTWMKNLRTRARVWAEFLRIEAYGSRGDIEYPVNAAESVREIRRLTNTIAGSV